MSVPFVKTVRSSAMAAFLCLLLAVSALSQEVVIQGRCIGVHDGDSITLLTPARTQLKIRIAFIDAAELGQPFGYRAKQAMSQLVFGKDIALYPHTIDRYRRTVGVIYSDGTDAGLELLHQGLAWCYGRYLSEASFDIQSSYQQAQADARLDRRGLVDQSGSIPALGMAQNHKAGRTLDSPNPADSFGSNAL
jgi:endonuclease YncB( thermonuclease family)